MKYTHGTFEGFCKNVMPINLKLSKCMIKKNTLAISLSVHKNLRKKTNILPDLLKKIISYLYGMKLMLGKRW